LKLSILDQSPIRVGGSAQQALNETIALAKLAEQLGYYRFWVSEHHSSEGLAGSSPEILITRLAAETSRIRIGSGGVMLPHYSPLKVAENFKVLEAMFPNRIDLGIGRAPGSDQLTAAALAYGNPYGSEYFPTKIADLQAFLLDQPTPTEAFRKVVCSPKIETQPEMWMLGSSEDSAHFAAKFGLPYSFAYFINADIRPDIFDIYRREFKPSAFCQEPRTSLGIFMLCTDTEAEAERLAKSRDLWYLRFAQQAGVPQIPSPEEGESYPYTPQEQAFINDNRRKMILGTPDKVAKKLRDIANTFETEELVTVCITHSFEARCRSYELLANEFQL